MAVPFAFLDLLRGKRWASLTLSTNLPEHRTAQPLPETTKGTPTQLEDGCPFRLFCDNAQLQTTILTPSLPPLGKLIAEFFVGITEALAEKNTDYFNFIRSYMKNSGVPPNRISFTR